MEKQHTFVICAYQESEYLEECIRSLMRQTVKSEILMATSTPNPYIKKSIRKVRNSAVCQYGRAGNYPGLEFRVPAGEDAAGYYCASG